MKKLSGFTLIEILIVLAVLVVVARGAVVLQKQILPPQLQKPTPQITPRPTVVNPTLPTTTMTTSCNQECLNRGYTSGTCRVEEFRPACSKNETDIGINFCGEEPGFKCCCDQKVVGPTVGSPVSPEVFEGDLRDLPTAKPFPTEYYRPISEVACQTVKDCYDSDGVTFKGVCSSPCILDCINGQCTNINPPGGICLSKDTLIATPKGLIPVQNLRTGMKIWALDAKGQRKAVSILKTVKTPVPDNHKIVHLLLKDGRELFASPGHPTASGQRLGDLSPGDVLDGAQVIEIKRVPYQEKYTHDILPAGETGFYWANGVLLKSTLVKGGQCQKQK